MSTLLTALARLTPLSLCGGSEVCLRRLNEAVRDSLKKRDMTREGFCRQEGLDCERLSAILGGFPDAARGQKELLQRVMDQLEISLENFMVISCRPPGAVVADIRNAAFEELCAPSSRG